MVMQDANVPPSRLLLVDDDPSLLLVLSRTLQIGLVIARSMCVSQGCRHWTS